MIHFIKNKGIVSLTTVLVIGTVVMETAIVGLAVSYLVGEQGLGLKMSYNASLAARSGVDDVLLRIARDKQFVITPGPSYTLTVNNFQADVTATRTILDTRYVQYSITSVGTAVNKKVKVSGTVIVDDYTGAINNQSFQEVSVN